MSYYLESISSLFNKGDHRSSNTGSSENQSYTRVSSNDTQTPRQSTSNTTTHWGSKAGSTFGDNKTETSRHEVPHCKTCTCPPISKDPDILKDSSGRPYSGEQLNLVATMALERYRSTQDGTERHHQMWDIRRALKQSELPYKDAILEEASGFTRPDENDRNYWIREIMDEKTGFPATLEEAFKASCIPNSEFPREGMKGSYNRLKMARLRYSQR